MDASIRILEEFVELAKTGRLSTAARNLFMSPSTLSAHIASLEKNLGCTLFERGSGMTLTAKGDLALEHAQRILFEYEGLRNACMDEGGKSVELRTPNYYLGSEPLLAVRDEFLLGHPGYRVSIKTNELQMADPNEILEGGLCDVARMYVVGGSGDELTSLVSPGTDSICLGARRFVLLTTANHPLAGKSVIDSCDLDGQTFVTSLSPLSLTTIDGARKSLAHRGVETRVLYRHVNRHSDIFATGFEDCVSLGFENKTGAYPSGAVVRELSFDLSADVYLLYRADRLDEHQRAYIETVRGVSARESLLP